MVQFTKIVLILGSIATSVCQNLSELILEIPLSCSIIIVPYPNDNNNLSLEGAKHPWVLLQPNTSVPSEITYNTNTYKRTRLLPARTKRISCAFNIHFANEQDQLWNILTNFPNWVVGNGGVLRRKNLDFVIYISTNVDFKDFYNVYQKSLMRFQSRYFDSYTSAFLSVPVKHDGYKLYLLLGRYSPEKYKSHETMISKLRKDLFGNHNYAPPGMRIRDRYSVTDEEVVLKSPSEEYQFLRIVASAGNQSFIFPRGFSLDNMWYPSIVTGITNCFNCQVISLSTQSIQAFTCYSPPELNFRMYYIPFENSVWI